MTITYYCLSCFKIESRDSVVVLDPPSKKSGLRPPRFQADIVLSSHWHDRHNGTGEISGRAGESPFVITGPGEYEIRNIKIKGVSSSHDDVSGKKQGRNTIYLLEIEDMTICFMGDFGENELDNQKRELIGTPDILFLPIGGGTVIETNKAAAIARSIEPRIIIPMHWALSEKESKNDELKKFLRDVAEGKIEPLEKLTVKKKEIPQEKTQVAVLKPTI